MKKFRAILFTLAMMLCIAPQAFAAEYEYEVKEVYFTDLVGNVLENPGRSCMVNIKVTKLTDRLGEDDMVIASYATDGTMIGFTALGGTMDKGETNTYKTLVSAPEGKNIGVIKTYVWNNIAEMKPLSLVEQTVVNEMDEGVYLPPVNEKPGGESYVPSTITVRGAIVDTPLSNYSLANNEYKVSGLHIPDDPAIFDGVYNEEDYEALRARLEAASEAYGLPLGQDDAISANVTSDIDLCDYLLQFMEFEIRIEDGEYVVVTAQPYEGVINTIYLQAEDYVAQSKLKYENRYSTTNKIRFGSKYYKINTADVVLYVNGIKKDAITINETNLDKYIGSAVGTVKLVDNKDADGYEVIMVDNWNVAKVSSVVYENGATTITIASHKLYAGTEYEEIVIDDEDVEEGKMVVNVTKNGEAADLASLAKNDIIAYKTEINGARKLTSANIRAIDIKATNDVVTGKVTSEDIDEKTYTIDGTVYKTTNRAMPLTVGMSYKLTLDPFGGIYGYEADTSSILYAIALGADKDDSTIKLLLADGTTRTYEVDEKSFTMSGFASTAVDNAFVSYLETASPKDRVVTYKVRNSNGKITAIAKRTALDANWDTTLAKAEYNGRTAKLGDVLLNDDVIIFDARVALKESNKLDTASGYALFDINRFEDGGKYSYAAFKEGTETKLVILSVVGTMISRNSRFAVVRKAPSTIETEDGDEVDSVIVLADGEAEKELYFVPGVYAAHRLDVGDAFYYELDSYDCVNDVFKVLDASSKTFTDLKAALGYKGDYISTDANEDYSWGFDLLAKHDIQLVEGYVVSGENVVTFVEAKKPLNKIDTTVDLNATKDNYGVVVFATTDDTQVYVFDTQLDEFKYYNMFSVKADTSSLTSTGLDKYYDDKTKVYSSTEDMSARANYAVAMIVNDEVVEIYAIK